MDQFLKYWHESSHSIVLKAWKEPNNDNIKKNIARYEKEKIILNNLPSIYITIKRIAMQEGKLIGWKMQFIGPWILLI